MKFAVVILACVAAASAQYNPYNPFNNQYNNRYNNAFGQYNGQYNNGQYNNGQFNRYNPFPYNQFSTPKYSVSPVVTPAPVFVSSTPAPVLAPVPTPLSVAVKDYGRYAPNAQVLREGNEINPDGSYRYFFETDNGIAAQAQGTLRSFAGNPASEAVVAEGQFSWISPEGVPIQIAYVADENGYQPRGDAIPTPPPIPAAILRSLEYNAKFAPQQKK